MTIVVRASCAVVCAVLFTASGTGCFFKASTASHMERGNRYVAAGQYDEAELEYRNVLQKEPLHPGAIIQLGFIYLEQGRLSRIYPFLAKARELQPENVDVRLKLAMFYATIGRFNEMREEALYILQHRPNDEYAPVLLAESTVQPREIEDSRQQLRMLPAPAADAAPALVGLAILDVRQRKLKEAEALLERALRVNPKLAAAHLALGGLYAAQNEIERAEKSFAEAATLSPARSPNRLRHAHFLVQIGKADEARRILQEMTKKAPDYIPGWLLLADIDAAAQRLDEALVAVGRVLTRDNTHPEALLVSGKVKLAKGDKAKAIDDLERAVKLYSQSSQLHQQLAVSYLAAGDLGKASASAGQAATLAPGNPQPLLLMAEINLRQGNHAAAISGLQQLVQKAPNLVQARLLLAQVYRTQGNLAGALTAYRDLMTIAPNNPQVPLQMGMIFLQQRKLPEAREAFTKALSIDRDFVPALEQIVNIEVHEKNYAGARDRLEAQLTRHPNAEGLYHLLSRVHLAAGDRGKAESALRKAIEVQPESPVAYLALARMYLTANEHQQALANLELAAAKNPRQIEPLMLAAAIYDQQKNLSRARETYEKILSINPKFSPALNNLAYLYSEHFSELEKAFDLAQKAREFLPREPNVADTLGWILYKKGEYPWALSLLSESADRLPTSADVHYHLGMTHYMMGDEAAAKAALQRALNLKADFPGADEARQSLKILAINPGVAGDEVRPMLEQAVARRSDPVAMARLGLLYERTGALDKAAAAYESALKTSPHNIPAATNLIRVYRARKDTARAMELAKSARKMAPTDGGVAHALGQLAFESGDHSWALSLLQDALRNEPGNPELLFDFAMASYSVGQVPAAEAAFRDALKANPAFLRSSRAREWLDLVHIASDPEKAPNAESKVAEALKIDPANPAALVAAAALAERRRDAAAARQAYEKVIGRYPDFTPAHRQLAVLSAQMKGDDPRALEYATKARSVYPDDAELAKAFGVLVFRQGNFARAQNLLQESSRRLTGDAEIMYYLGMAQHGLKNRMASVRSLQRALELGLNGDLAAEARRVIAAPAN